VNSDTYVNVEMQLFNTPGLPARALYYWAKLFSSQLHQGEDYSSLKKTISIVILDDTYCDSDDYHTWSGLHDCRQKIVISDLIEVHFLELPKLHNLSGQDIDNDCIKWMKFFNAKTKEELIMLSEASPSIKKATNLLMSMSMDEETRQKYEEREEYLFERKMMLQFAEKAGMEKGIEIGREEGKVEGREEGIEIGIEKGKVEGREEGIEIGREKGKVEGREEGIEIGIKKGKVEGKEEGMAIAGRKVAINLVALGMDDDTISKVTGLSQEEVKKLREQ
jgi:predicted transposase/invertase (TIGR01784 family)